MYIQRTKVYSLSTQMTAGFVFFLRAGISSPLSLRLDPKSYRCGLCARQRKSLRAPEAGLLPPAAFSGSAADLHAQEKSVHPQSALGLRSGSRAGAFLRHGLVLYLQRHPRPPPDARRHRLFVLALALAYYAAYRLIRSHPARIKGFDLIGGAVLFMLALLLIVFTYLPPHLPWFCDR